MNIKGRIKLAVFTLAKWTGMFRACRVLMRRRLMIVGYHGFQIDDEARFRPALFMQAERFARRLDIIARGKYPLLPLAEAVRRLKDGTLPPSAVVITIDDGFFSVLDLAAPLLKEHGFPATLYVTSYYVIKGSPVFRLTIQYLFWKSKCTSLEPSGDPWSPAGSVDLGDTDAARHAMRKIIDYGEENCDEARRQEISEKVAMALGLDYERVAEARGLSLLSAAEVARLESFGIDVQLHTHRHMLPVDDLDRARTELRENREVLEEILGRQLEHFCYPSGIWTRDILPMLEEEGIVSATTCQAGMNKRTTNPLALYRVLDRDDLREIEFEAELSGFCELLRMVSGRCLRSEKLRATGQRGN